MKPAGIRTILEYRVVQIRRRLAVRVIHALDAIADRLNVWGDRLALALLHAEQPRIEARQSARVIMITEGVIQPRTIQPCPDCGHQPRGWPDQCPICGGRRIATSQSTDVRAEEW